MPFVEEDMDNFIDDVPIPQIGTDLFGGYDDEEPLDSGPVIISETFEAETENKAKTDDPETVDRVDNNSDIEDQNGTANDPDEFSPMEEDDAPAPVSAKKRGRSSLSASRTSTPAKTPKLAKSSATPAASSGRKRKAVDFTDEPPVKRSGRATAAAAQEAIKEASKKRPRAPNGSAKPKPAKTPRSKPGRKPKVEVEAEDDKSDEEYEVEVILDDDVDAKTKEAIYWVKWKGYGQKDNTWEPKKNLTHAVALLKKYEASNKEKKAAPKKAAAKKTAAPAKKAAATFKKKAAPVKAAGRATRRGPGRPKKN